MARIVRKGRLRRRKRRAWWHKHGADYLIEAMLRVPPEQSPAYHLFGPPLGDGPERSFKAWAKSPARPSA